MHRRHLITALACWPALGLRAQDEGERPRLKLSAARLYDTLSTRFPLRFGVQGLLDVQVSATRLHLLPARNQLGVGLLAQPSGPGLPRVPPAEIDVAFGLRYEAADRTIRAHHPDVLDVRLPGLPPDAAVALQGLLPQVARQAVGEVVLQRLSDQDLVLADTLGVEPQTLTVVDDGVLVLFGPKSRR